MSNPQGEINNQEISDNDTIHSSDEEDVFGDDERKEVVVNSSDDEEEADERDEFGKKIPDVINSSVKSIDGQKTVNKSYSMASNISGIVEDALVAAPPVNPSNLGHDMGFQTWLEGNKTDIVKANNGKAVSLTFKNLSLRSPPIYTGL